MFCESGFRMVLYFTPTREIMMVCLARYGSVYTGGITLNLETNS